MKKILNVYKAIGPEARASMWFLFANIFQKIVMIIFTRVFTEVMTPGEFSKYAVFQSWEAIITVFATLNISSYATAKALVDIEDKENFIFSAEVLTVLLTAISFGMFYLIKMLFGGLDSLPFPIVVSLFCDIVFVAIFNFWSQLERYHLRYKALVASSIFVGILSPVLAFLLICNSGKIGLNKEWARIVSVVTLNGILACAILIVRFRKNTARFTVKYWRYCIGYCIPLIPHFLAAAFLQKSSQLFVDKYAGGDSSGIYSLANSLAMMIMVFNDALTKTLVPWTYKKLAEKKYEEINMPIVLSLGAIGVIALLMCLCAPEIVFLFADEAYRDAIYAIPPLAGVTFLAFIYNAYTNVEYYYKETQYVSAASMVAGVSIVIFEILSVPRFGYIAAAYSTFFCYGIYALMHYCFMKKTIKRNIEGITIYNNSVIFKLTVCFTCCLLVMPLLYYYRYVRYSIIIIIVIILSINAKNIICYFKGLTKK